MFTLYSYFQVITFSESGNEFFEKMKEVLLDARAAGERLIKDLLKISGKLDQNDTKSQSEVLLGIYYDPFL